MDRRRQEIPVHEKPGRPPLSRHTTDFRAGRAVSCPACHRAEANPSRAQEGRACLAGIFLYGRKSRVSDVMGEEALRLLPVRPTAPGRGGTEEADTGKPLPEVSPRSPRPSSPRSACAQAPRVKPSVPPLRVFFPTVRVSALLRRKTASSTTRKSRRKNKAQLFVITYFYKNSSLSFRPEKVLRPRTDPPLHLPFLKIQAIASSPYDTRSIRSSSIPPHSGFFMEEYHG